MALVAALIAPGGSARAATTVRTIHARPLPAPRLPNKRYHTEFVVQVNKLGQIVRVKSGKGCSWPAFNAMTYGNALQAFIRTPDGAHAIVGTYRLTYDYDPRTHGVRRGVQLLWAGGNWGNQEGAATQMQHIAERQNREHSKPLPDFNAITKNKKVSKAPR